MQYPVINHNGKEYKKEYIYVQLNHFVVQQKLTHRKSTIYVKKNLKNTTSTEQ